MSEENFLHTVTGLKKIAEIFHHPEGVWGRAAALSHQNRLLWWFEYLNISWAPFFVWRFSSNFPKEEDPRVDLKLWEETKIICFGLGTNLESITENKYILVSPIDLTGTGGRFDVVGSKTLQQFYVLSEKTRKYFWHGCKSSLRQCPG